MGELAVGILLAAAAVWFVLAPILRPARAAAAAAEAAAGEGDDPDEDASPRTVALRALKEIEFDRATGKLSDADYEALQRKYTAEALAALRAEPGPEPEAGAAPPGARPPQRAEAGRASEHAPACPAHGRRPEPGAEFCSDCGRRLAPAPGYCAQCGTALERAARYCHACGARVAA
jgi:hypothetical protein